MEEKINEIHKLVHDLREKYEQMEQGIFSKAEFKEFQEKIEKRIDELETVLKTPKFETKEEKKESEEKKIFEKWARKGLDVLTPEEKKVLKLSDDTTGGYLAPTEYVQEIIKGITEYSPVRTVARIRTTSARSIQFPVRKGTFTAQWISETGTKSETTGLKYGLEEIPNHELYAEIIITNQDLEDSAFDLEREIITEISEQFGVAEGKAFISGDAVGKPEGILTNANVGEVVSGNASALTADGIINLAYGLKAVYAKNAIWLMKRDTVRQIRLLKDTNNQYLWQPGLSAGEPSLLLSRPILECPDMPSVAANAYPVVFGDFQRGYIIVDRIQISIQRLVEKYAEQGQIAFLARKRVGGQVVLAEAIKKQKVSA